MSVALVHGNCMSLFNVFPENDFEFNNFCYLTVSDNVPPNVCVIDSVFKKNEIMSAYIILEPKTMLYSLKNQLFLFIAILALIAK